MSFVTSKYDAQFASLVLTRVRDVLVRDCDTAIANLNVDAQLKSFVTYDVPIKLTVNFPCVYLEPLGSDLQQSDDDSHINQEHKFLVSIACDGPTPQSVDTDILHYTRAVDQVLRTMTVDDLTDGVTTVIGPPVWEVTAHDYGQSLTDGTIYRKDAQLQLVVQILER